jgi:hypothetical protein
VSGLGFVVLLALFVAVAVVRNEMRRARERTEAAVVEVGPLGVRRLLADGRDEEVHWDELEVVEVVRARAGPHKGSGGVLLLGAGLDRGCLVPLDRAGELGVVERLAALPGFDVARLVEAMDARPPARIVVWGRRPGDDGSP